MVRPFRTVAQRRLDGFPRGKAKTRSLCCRPSSKADGTLSNALSLLPVLICARRIVRSRPKLHTLDHGVA